MTTVKRFEDLEIWQLARLICKKVFEITCRNPFSKDFSLKNQIRRSSGSIMDNIPEGFERDGKQEFVQYLSIAKGSCGECRSQLYRAVDRKYITNAEFDELYNLLTMESQKISSFIRYLKKTEYKGRKYK
ncbi:MAG: four helix bundle protein [Bacteroidales bacterium]